jgi:hypothetical protein
MKGLRLFVFVLIIQFTENLRNTLVEFPETTGTVSANAWKNLEKGLRFFKRSDEFMPLSSRSALTRSNRIKASLAYSQQFQ